MAPNNYTWAPGVAVIATAPSLKLTTMLGVSFTTPSYINPPSILVDPVTGKDYPPASGAACQQCDQWVGCGSLKCGLKVAARHPNITAAGISRMFLNPGVYTGACM